MTSLVFGPFLCKTLIRVEYMSNGVVNRSVLFFMLVAIFGYFRPNHSGSTNEKNGIRSSSLPCCVFRTFANLRVDTIRPGLRQGEVVDLRIRHEVKEKRVGPYPLNLPRPRVDHKLKIKAFRSIAWVDGAMWFARYEAA